MRALAAVLGLLCGGACAGAPAATRPPTPNTTTTATPLRWAVSLGPDLLLAQRICRADDVPFDAADLEDIGPVAPRARDVATTPQLVDGCIEFRIDLAAAATVFRDRTGAERVADDVVLASPDVWLWTRRRPVGGTLTLTTAPEVRAVLPFPRIAGSDDREIDASTWRLLSVAAFGAVDVRPLPVAGAILDVVTLPGERFMVDADVDRWLGAAADAVATGSGARGRFPFERAMIVVEPVRGDDVPFGMVTRGGGPQATLLLGERARVDDVIDDWVAVHELSHLLHPLVGLDEAWFGEGLATWHQVVLRARAGLIDEDEAWAALRDGFERGRAAAERGPWTLPLREASARMRAEGRWIQTYWGGAAVVFALDVGLRRCGGGSIDDVVATLRAEQPRVDAQRLPALTIVTRAAATAPACARLKADVERMLAEPFPRDALPLLDALGASPGGLTDDAPLAALRPGIVAPRRITAAAAAPGHRSAP